MAKDSWLTVNPMAGEGNATLTNSGTIHKGRLERQTVAPFLYTPLNKMTGQLTFDAPVIY